MIKLIAICILTACGVLAATNTVARVPRERKATHELSRITVKSREKGSKKESDYTTDRAIPLMFDNNKFKAKPKKEKRS